MLAPRNYLFISFLDVKRKVSKSYFLKTVKICVLEMTNGIAFFIKYNMENQYYE